MATTYLFPCTCGRKIAVQPRQAGELLVCACGAQVHAPTWLEITALEPALTEQAPRPGWGVPQGLRLLGTLILLVAITVAAVVHWRRPRPPTEGITLELIQQNIDTLSPWESIQFYRHTLETGLDPSKQRIEKYYEIALVRYWGWLGAMAVLGIAGGVLIGVGLWKSHRADPTS